MILAYNWQTFIGKSYAKVFHHFSHQHCVSAMNNPTCPLMNSRVWGWEIFETHIQNVTHWTNLIWHGCSMYWVHVWFRIVSSYNAFSEVHSHITHTSLWGLNRYQINNVQKPLHVPLVSSLSFSGLSFPACKIPFWDDGHYISVPRIRAHRFVKCARLFLIAGALTFHPIYCSSAIEGLQGYTENVTVVSRRLFTSRVNTCWAFFRMAPETHLWSGVRKPLQ